MPLMFANLVYSKFQKLANFYYESLKSAYFQRPDLTFRLFRGIILTPLSKNNSNRIWSADRPNSFLVLHSGDIFKT